MKNKTSSLALADSDRIFVWNKHVALAFLVPFGIMLLAFALCRIYPFGTQGVFAIDLYHMYAPLTGHVHDMVFGGQGGAYSWNIGMGINFFGLYFTNVGSPLNFIAGLLPKEWLMDSIGLIMLIKIGLSGMFTALYMRYRWKKLDLATVMFAAMYALCGYMVNYYWNIMWTDLLFLLPLILIGIEELIKRGRFMLYTLTLMASMICNYYIALLMCVFLVMYFIIAVFTRYTWRDDMINILKSTARFAGFSVLAAGLAAVVLLPVYNALQMTTAVEGFFPRGLETYFSMLEVLGNHLPGYPANIRSGGLPHLYTGLLAFLLIPVYIVNKRISRRERCLSVGVCVIMLLCMNFNIPNYIWHGMHFPNDIPFRFSFCYSFMIAIMAYNAFRNIRAVSGKFLGGCCTGLIGFIFLTEAIWKNNKNLALIYITPLLLGLYALIYFVYRRGTFSYKGMQIVMAVAICAELAWSSTAGAAGVGNMNREIYFENMGDYESLISEAAENDPSFYRMEILAYKTLNDPALYGYRGITHFSSMIGAKFQEAMQHFGYGGYMYGTVRSNRAVYMPNTPIGDSILALKYIMTRGDKPYERALWDFARQSEHGVKMYENKYALPIGFLVSDELLTRWNSSQSNPFDVQRGFVNNATGGSYAPFVQLNVADFDSTGLTATSSGANSYRFSGSNTSSPGTLTASFRSETDAPLYVMVSSSQCTNVRVTIGDKTESYEGQYPRILSIGSPAPGETVKVAATLGRNSADGDVTFWMYQLDMQQFDSAMSDMASGSLQNVTFGGDWVRGTANVSGRTLLFTSIPYDKGWTVTVDGVEGEITPIGDGFVGVQLEPGKHEIELRYKLRGFSAGLIITAISALLLAALYVLQRLRAARKAAPVYTLPAPRLPDDWLPPPVAADAPPAPSGSERPPNEPSE